MNTLSFETEMIEFDTGFSHETYKAFFYVIDGERIKFEGMFRPLSKYGVLQKPFWNDKYKIVALSGEAEAEEGGLAKFAEVLAVDHEIVWLVMDTETSKTKEYRFSRDQYDCIIQEIEQAAKTDFDFGLFVHYENGSVVPMEFNDLENAVKYWNRQSMPGYLKVNFYESFNGGTCFRIKDGQVRWMIPMENQGTIQDLASSDEFRKLSEIKRTKDFGYCPIVFQFPKDSVKDLCSEKEASVILKRYVDLETFWFRAVCKTEKEFSDFTSHDWRVGNGSFAELVFSSENYGDANLYFWKELESLAGERWDELKEYYVELTSREVALLNYADGIWNSTDWADLELFKAVEEKFLEGVVSAVENGANVNAFDQDGNTPLINAINGFNSWVVLDDELDQEYGEAGRYLGILDFLIACGANPNLWGMEGLDCMSVACGEGNVEILRFLLSHGMRKDLNSALLKSDSEGWIFSSYAYHLVERELENEISDSEKPQEIMEILKEYGVKEWADGWDADLMESYLVQLKKHLIGGEDSVLSMKSDGKNGMDGRKQPGESEFEDEFIIDEFSSRYVENEDVSGPPLDQDLDAFFSRNSTDMKYYTFFRRYLDWPRQLDEYAHLFKERYGVFPNIVLMNRTTEGRLEDTFHEVIAKDMDWEESYELAIKLGIERKDSWDELEEQEDEAHGFDGDLPEFSSDPHFTTDEYSLVCLESFVLGSGVIELLRIEDSSSEKSM